MSYVVAYDICHPRRLRRVARHLERRAVRCQYSVFLFHGTEEALRTLLDELAALIRPDQDVVQAWPVPPGVSPEEYARGAVTIVRPATVVLCGGRPMLVPQPPSDSEPHQGDSP